MPAFLTTLLATATSDLSSRPETARTLDIACETCGFCSAPLGICVLYYIIGALAIALLLVILLMGRSKKCPLCQTKVKKGINTCPKCNHNFSDSISTKVDVAPKQTTASQPATIQPVSMVTPPAHENTPPAAPLAPTISANKPKACPNCGAEFTTEAMFCGKCGQRL